MLLPSIDFALGHIFRLHLDLDLGLCLLWRLFNSNLTLISHNPLVVMFQQFPGFPACSLWGLVVWVFNSVQARAEISWGSGFSWLTFPESQLAWCPQQASEAHTSLLALFPSLSSFSKNSLRGQPNCLGPLPVLTIWHPPVVMDDCALAVSEFQSEVLLENPWAC